MAETLFTDDVVIQGSRDIAQLDIKGNSTQTQPLQKWETSGSVVKAQVTAEGRLQVGDNLTAGIVPDALIQANGDVTLPSSQVPTGLHTIGKVQGTIPGGTSWTTHELRLDGSGTVSGTQSASRHKLTFGSTGDGSNGDLRATDTQAINEKGTSGLRLGRLTAIRALLSNALNAFLDRGSAVEAAITNDTGGNINRAIGVNVPTPVNAGTIGQLYGVRVEDLSAAGGTLTNYAALSVDNEVEMKLQAATPTKLPPTGMVKIYPKLSGSNPKLYAKDAAGTEFDLSGAGGAGSVTSVGLSMPTEFSVANSPVTSTGTLTVSKAIQNANTIYAGPSSGGAVAPGFRALTDADVPDALTIAGGTINNTPIGATTPSTLVGTTVQANTAFIVGSGGSRLQNSSGTVRVRNSSDTADAALQAALLTLTGGGPGAGKVLTSDASGNASWQTPTAGTLDDGLCEGRLTLTSGVPITTSDVTAATTLYFTPFGGNRVALYNGTSWSIYTFTERSLSLSGFIANTSYDIFLYDNAGTLTLEATAWTNATTRATALVLQEGIYVRSGATTRRYLGTIRIGATTGQTEDNARRRFIYNEFNAVQRRVAALETTYSWDYATATWRAANNSTANRVEVVVGNLGPLIKLDLMVRMSSSGAGAAHTIAYDTTSSYTTGSMYSNITTDGHVSAHFTHATQLGYHFYQWVENGRGTPYATVFGYADGAFQSGMTGDITL